LATSFPLALSINRDKSLLKLDEKLMRNLEIHVESKTITTKNGDKISYDEFNVSESKPILDEIDQVLATHYAFTDEELDFIPSTKSQGRHQLRHQVPDGARRGG